MHTRICLQRPLNGLAAEKRLDEQVVSSASARALKGRLLGTPSLYDSLLSVVLSLSLSRSSEVRQFQNRRHRPLQNAFIASTTSRMWASRCIQGDKERNLHIQSCPCLGTEALSLSSLTLSNTLQVGGWSEEGNSKTGGTNTRKMNRHRQQPLARGPEGAFKETVAFPSPRFQGREGKESGRREGKNLVRR